MLVIPGPVMFCPNGATLPWPNAAKPPNKTNKWLQKKCDHVKNLFCWSTAHHSTKSCMMVDWIVNHKYQGIKNQCNKFFWAPTVGLLGIRVRLGERLSRKRLLEVSTEAGGKVVRSSVSKPSRHAHGRWTERGYGTQRAVR